MAKIIIMMKTLNSLEEKEVHDKVKEEEFSSRKTLILHFFVYYFHFSTQYGVILFQIVIKTIIIQICII
jgi:hypothetical protein